MTSTFGGALYECLRLGGDRRFLVGKGLKNNRLLLPPQVHMDKRHRRVIIHFKGGSFSLNLNFECRCGFLALRFASFFDDGIFRLACENDPGL